VSTWNVKAVIMPKPGVNDPQGEAIRGGLESLEFAGVRDVRAGRQIAITLDAETRQSAMATVERMCDQLLANPVIETYTVSLDEALQEGRPLP
jgi:phosphoribosylformylglycinamidine synthase subunit PurS